MAHAAASRQEDELYLMRGVHAYTDRMRNNDHRRVRTADFYSMMASLRP